MEKRFLHFFLPLLYIGSIYVFSGCRKDWLSAKSDKQQSVPSTLKDFQAILNDEILNFETTSTLSELASDGHHVTDDAWDGTNDDLNLNAYIWSNERPYDNFYWTTGYRNIFSTNVVLDALNIYRFVDKKEEDEWRNIKGQALFHRAFAFYRAAQVWAPPYNSSTSNKELGIPLRTEADVTIPSVRSSVEQTYSLIISDLQEAARLLSPDFVVKTRPFKLAVFALLARVYLSMREYSLAGDFADSCLSMNNSLMDYNNLSPTASFIGDVNDNPEVIFYQYYYSTNFLTTACFIDKALYETYDENDLRKEVFFRENIDGSISFEGNYNNSDWALFSGLSNDELYLIRAESHARLGRVNLAMKDLNDLLRTRWKKVNGVSTYLDQDATDVSDALRKILLERNKSLMMRGLRWPDLRRLNFEEDFKMTLTRAIGGGVYILEPSSFRYTFPIPSGIIASSSIQQNPGW